MATTRRTRKDPRKEATRIAIIEAAESLFAEQGLEGVSLRQIGSAIGSSNTSVVAYHFGNKDTLVEAIFHFRLPDIEARRQALLQEVLEQNTDSEVYPLLRALWLPLFEQVNDVGKHSYAGFMAALMHSSFGDIRLALSHEYPTASELGERLKQAMPIAQQPRFESRLTMTTVMVTGALKLMDQTNSLAATKSHFAGNLFEDTLRMASAAFTAPTGE